jgi:hypothetical protein
MQHKLKKSFSEAEGGFGVGRTGYVHVTVPAAAIPNVAINSPHVETAGIGSDVSS